MADSDGSISSARVHKSLEALPLHSIPRANLPRNGLYFFYEEGEVNGHDGGPRIVRVGNHPRSQDRLIGRLRDHYTGSKNGSVFRKFLGGALMRKLDPDHPCLQPSPGQGHWEKQDAPTCEVCHPLETDVSRILREKFSFRCVRIDDMEERNKMEEGLIAALAQCPDCVASPRRLGRFTYSVKVQESGLWNSNHVRGSDSLTSEELARFEVLCRSSR